MPEISCEKFATRTGIEISQFFSLYKYHAGTFISYFNNCATNTEKKKAKWAEKNGYECYFKLAPISTNTHKKDYSYKKNQQTN